MFLFPYFACNTLFSGQGKVKKHTQHTVEFGGGLQASSAFGAPAAAGAGAFGGGGASPFGAAAAAPFGAPAGLSVLVHAISNFWYGARASHATGAAGIFLKIN